MGAYVFRLIPSRSTFVSDMTPPEAELMGVHAQYWRELMARGHVVGFGPVDDPTGGYGIALVIADSAEQAQSFADEDPAVISALRFTTEITPMLNLVTPDSLK
jgi:uncharacterized protein YciI